jgi:hypothetical protein
MFNAVSYLTMFIVNSAKRIDLCQSADADSACAANSDLIDLECRLPYAYRD